MLTTKNFWQGANLMEVHLDDNMKSVLYPEVTAKSVVSNFYWLQEDDFGNEEILKQKGVLDYLSHKDAIGRLWVTEDHMKQLFPHTDFNGTHKKPSTTADATPTEQELPAVSGDTDGVKKRGRKKSV